MVNKKAYKEKYVSKISVYFSLYLLPNKNMVLTGNQISSLFEYVNQMGIANLTRIFIQDEVITNFEDLFEFTKENIWRQFIENCKCPPHVKPFGGGALLPNEPYCISEK